METDRRLWLDGWNRGDTEPLSTEPLPTEPATETPAPATPPAGKPVPGWAKFAAAGATVFVLSFAYSYAQGNNGGSQPQRSSAAPAVPQPQIPQAQAPQVPQAQALQAPQAQAPQTQTMPPLTTQQS